MIGVVADDLTGAAEVGALGVRYGMEAEVVVEGQPSGRSELVCIDTDSRSCGPEEARRRAAAAAASLSAAGAAWIYKKVDSVLRGAVVAELAAVMTRLHAVRTLLVPANPGLGRVIRGGRYFLNGKPIDQTDFRYDPEFPRSTSTIRDLLGKPDSLTIHVCRTDEPLPSAGLTVGEAQSAEDLRAWAGRCDSSTLAAGGAEFFAALLAAAGYHLGSPRADPPLSPKNGRQLFVCGSASAACKQFVHDTLRDGFAVFEAQANVMTPADQIGLANRISTALESSPRVVLTIGAKLDLSAAAGQSLLDKLTGIAALVISRGTIRRVYAEGGATAARLVRRLGWNRLDVLRELAPGVVTLGVAGSQDCLLTIKPGSYSWPAAVRGPAE